MDKFLTLDKIIRDAFVAGDTVLLLKVADMLAVYADERTLSAVLGALDHKEVSA
jgi:hypothetical protein